MNLAQLAEEFGTTPAVIRQLFPDVLEANTPDDTSIPDYVIVLMRRAWTKKFGPDTIFGGKAPDFVINVDTTAHQFQPLASETIAAWRELRLQLASETTNRWAVTIDPFDQIGMIYVMVTLYGEMKWSDRGPELHNLLVRTTEFLKDAMK